MVVATLCLGLTIGVTADAQAQKVSPDRAYAFLIAFAGGAVDILQAPALDHSEKKQQLRALLADGFALDLIGTFVLGPHSKKFTDVQRERYRSTYFEYVLATYYQRLKSFDKWNVEFMSAKSYGDRDALVPSRIRREKDTDIRVDWRITDHGGELKIVDVLFEGVSLAVTQKSEFNAVLSRGGYAAIMKAMRGKIGQLSS